MSSDCSSLAALLAGVANPSRWPERRRYRPCTIRKPDGALRQVLMPNGDFEAVLRQVQRLLQPQLTVHYSAHGFVPGRSVVSHARLHVTPACLLTCDLHDFFGSITLDAVQATIYRCCQDKVVARRAAKLLTYRGALPQGASTSPALSNAVFEPLDRKLSYLAVEHNAAYSRYVDDIAVSWKAAPTARGPQALLDAMTRVLATSGYSLAEKKTRVAWPTDRQEVTGFVVNRATVPWASGLRPTREYRRRVRAEVHALLAGRYEGSAAALSGKIAHIRRFCPMEGLRLQAAVEVGSTSFRSTPQ